MTPIPKTRDAESGDAESQCALGLSSEPGDGLVPKDSIEAYKWHSLAAGSGDKRAADYLRTIASRMSSQQITEAQLSSMICFALICTTLHTKTAFDKRQTPP